MLPPNADVKALAARTQAGYREWRSIHFQVSGYLPRQEQCQATERLQTGVV